MRSTDQERADFEAWVSTQSVVKKYGAKLHRSTCGNHYKDLRINQRWLAFKAGRAAQQSQDREDAYIPEKCSDYTPSITDCDAVIAQREGYTEGGTTAARMSSTTPAALRVKGKTMNINIIDKDTVSVNGSLFKRVVVEEEILICTIDGYQYFLGPEYKGVLEWADAKKWCESLGEGYELPNRLVMLAMCMNEETAAKLTEDAYYWTSSEFADDASGAWRQGWASSVPGGQYYSRKSVARRLRAVRRRRVEGGGE